MNRCSILPDRLPPAILILSAVALLLTACGLQGGAAPAPSRAPAVAPAPSRAPATAPAPSPAPPSDAYASVDRALAALNTANIAFNTPDKINLHETAQIELLLSLQKTAAELSATIQSAGQKQSDSVQASSRMDARLSGSDFQITAITPEEQAIGSVDTVQWQWEIKPLATGRHRLHLTLTALLDIDGSTTRRAIRTFDKEIEVEVTIGQSAKGFLDSNWQWLWAAIMVPIAGFLWKRLSGKKHDSKQSDT